MPTSPYTQKGLKNYCLSIPWDGWYSQHFAQIPNYITHPTWIFIRYHHCICQKEIIISFHSIPFSSQATMKSDYVSSFDFMLFPLQKWYSKLFGVRCLFVRTKWQTKSFVFLNLSTSWTSTSSFLYSSCLFLILRYLTYSCIISLWQNDETLKRHHRENYTEYFSDGLVFKLIKLDFTNTNSKYHILESWRYQKHDSGKMNHI